MVLVCCKARLLQDLGAFDAKLVANSHRPHLVRQPLQGVEHGDYQHSEISIVSFDALAKAAQIEQRLILCPLIPLMVHKTLQPASLLSLSC